MVGVRNALNREEAAACLARTKTFVDVGRALCWLTRPLGIAQCTVASYVSDRPVMTIDNLGAAIDDEHRCRYLAEDWIDDHALRELRNHHAPVAEHDLGGRLLPILALGQLLGSIRGRATRRIDGELDRDLATLAGYATAHCGQLGLCATPDPTLARLTQRQREVAQLAARGRTANQIAEALDISEDTVKKHLKDVFSRLEIHTRFELIPLMRHDSPREPEGITRDGDITITRVR